MKRGMIVDKYIIKNSLLWGTDIFSVNNGIMRAYITLLLIQLNARIRTIS